MTNKGYHCSCGDEHAISALVAEDFGIALVADVEDIHEQNVKILPVSDVHLVHTVYLAHMKDQFMIPAVKNFIQFIRKESTHYRTRTFFIYPANFSASGGR